MKTCDRCSKRADELYIFEVIAKPKRIYDDSIREFDIEVCEDCHGEGERLLNDLHHRLAFLQRDIMTEAASEWLKTPVPHTTKEQATIGASRPRPYQFTNATGHAFIDRFKARLRELFKRSKADNGL
jgi:hypothetical protein